MHPHRSAIRNFFKGRKRTERKKPRGPANNSGSPPLDSASPGHPKTPGTEWQWTGLSPAPQPGNLSDRHDFGGENSNPLSLEPRCCRNLNSSYSWPPHLYQEHSESREPRSVLSTYNRLAHGHDRHPFSRPRAESWLWSWWLKCVSSCIDCKAPDGGDRYNSSGTCRIHRLRYPRRIFHPWLHSRRLLQADLG